MLAKLSYFINSRNQVDCSQPPPPHCPSSYACTELFCEALIVHYRKEDSLLGGL